MGRTASEAASPGQAAFTFPLAQHFRRPPARAVIDAKIIMIACGATFRRPNPAQDLTDGSSPRHMG